MADLARTRFSEGRLATKPQSVPKELPLAPVLPTANLGGEDESVRVAPPIPDSATDTQENAPQLPGTPVRETLDMGKPPRVNYGETKRELITQDLTQEEVAKVLEALASFDQADRSTLYAFIIRLKKLRFSGVHSINLYSSLGKEVSDPLDAADLPNDADFFLSSKDGTPAADLLVTHKTGFPIRTQLWFQFIETVNDSVKSGDVVHVNSRSEFVVNFNALYQIAKGLAPAKPELEETQTAKIEVLPKINPAEDTPAKERNVAKEVFSEPPAEMLSRLIVEDAMLFQVPEDEALVIVKNFFPLMSELITSGAASLPRELSSTETYRLDQYLRAVEAATGIVVSVSSKNGETVLTRDALTKKRVALQSLSDLQTDVFASLNIVQDQPKSEQTPSASPVASSKEQTVEPDETDAETNESIQKIARSKQFKQGTVKVMVGAAKVMGSLFSGIGYLTKEAYQIHTRTQEKQATRKSERVQAERDRLEQLVPTFMEALKETDTDAEFGTVEFAEYLEELLILVDQSEKRRGIEVTDDKIRSQWQDLLQLLNEIYGKFEKYEEFKNEEGKEKRIKLWGNESKELARFLYLTAESIRSRNDADNRGPVDTTGSKMAEDLIQAQDRAFHRARRILQIVKDPRTRQLWEVISKHVSDTQSYTENDKKEESPKDVAADTAELKRKQFEDYIARQFLNKTTAA